MEKEITLTPYYIKVYTVDNDYIEHYVKTGSKTHDHKDNIWYSFIEDAYGMEPFTGNGIEMITESELKSKHNIEIPEVSNKYVEYLKEYDLELYEFYSSLSKKDLLSQICAEVHDLHNMNERVSTFMELCTNNMSKTTYTPESIKTLVQHKQEQDISDFCEDLLEYSDSELRQIIKNNIIK